MALLSCPTEAALQLSDDDIRIALCERLGAPRCPPDICTRRFRSGRTCGGALGGGWHAYCCPGLAGLRTQVRHNALVREFVSILTSAGRFVRVEQRDPLMGPTARLDIVELASAEGGAAAYDVSVVTPFRSDPTFVQACGRTEGWAAAQKHDAKLRRQYSDRVPGALLVPLVVEGGGRWHPSVPPLLRKLARAYVRRSPELPATAVGPVLRRWATRLSAALVRGNGHTVRAVVPSSGLTGAHLVGVAGLPHCSPEGDSSYELLVR